MRHVHFDTTSVSVWGDYLMRNEEECLSACLSAVAQAGVNLTT